MLSNINNSDFIWLIRYYYRSYLSNLEFHDLTLPWYGMFNRIYNKDLWWLWSQLSTLFLAYLRIFLFFSLSHPSFMLIVNFINLNMFWTRATYFEASALASLWKSLFTLIVLMWSQCVKIVYNSNTLFYEVPCKVLWYHNMPNPYGSENSLVQCHPGPEWNGLEIWPTLP